MSELFGSGDVYLNRINEMQSELTLLRARLSAAERVIEAARKLKFTMNYFPVDDAIKAYDQLTQRKEEK